jgi:hypothetical protein
MHRKRHILRSGSGRIERPPLREFRCCGSVWQAILAALPPFFLLGGLLSPRSPLSVWRGSLLEINSCLQFSDHTRSVSRGEHGQ